MVLYANDPRLSNHDIRDSVVVGVLNGVDCNFVLDIRQLVRIKRFIQSLCVILRWRLLSYCHSVCSLCWINENCDYIGYDWYLWSKPTFPWNPVSALQLNFMVSPGRALTVLGVGNDTPGGDWECSLSCSLLDASRYARGSFSHTMELIRDIIIKVNHTFVKCGNTFTTCVRHQQEQSTELQRWNWLEVITRWLCHYFTYVTYLQIVVVSSEPTTSLFRMFTALLIGMLC